MQIKTICSIDSKTSFFIIYEQKCKLYSHAYTKAYVRHKFAE